MGCGRRRRCWRGGGSVSGGRGRGCLLVGEHQSEIARGGAVRVGDGHIESIVSVSESTVGDAEAWS